MLALADVSRQEDVVEHYLESTVASNCDIHQWRKFHASGYPVLAKLQLIFLAVDTSSIA